MTRKRLFELANLILGCAHWGTAHRVNIEIDNNGNHRIRIHPYVCEKESKSTVYFSDKRYSFIASDEFIYDPNFDAAEARIRQLLEEIKEVE